MPPLVERSFCKLERFRRIATHFDKLARNLVTAALLASTKLKLIGQQPESALALDMQHAHASLRIVWLVASERSAILLADRLIGRGSPMPRHTWNFAI
ncbi:transposase [Shinella zoogloeoides]|uniref:Transposase n=1 Tax=Shinella zoogloeoides TaxID=352475 RepID=A0A6N8T765_SHIZO|nr:transposase [Shinella zoogloeoides]